MKALSIWQPWASLLMANIKEHETRGWPPPRSLLGERIAVHASKTRNGVDLFAASMGSPICVETQAAQAIGFSDPARPLPFGCILGTAVLSYAMKIDSVYASVQSARELALGDWTPGRWAWCFVDHRPLAAPIPYRGQQGIFDLPDSVLEGVPT